MGVCGSKPESEPATNEKMSGTRTVRTKQTTTKTQTSSTEKSKKPHSKKNNSKGDVVGTIDHSKEVKSKVADEKDDLKLSPREAARLAAEKRLQEQTKELTKGQLGKKLAEQKGLKA